MSVNKKCVQFMYKNILLFLILIMVANCDPAKKEAASLLTGEYPALYEAVYERDAELLLSFTTHQNEQIRTQAWNALINTPVSNMNAFIEQISEANTKEAWASLWLKELSDEQVERLNELFIASDVTNTGLVSALGQVGNSQSLELLMEEGVPPNTEMEFQLAYAIGSLTRDIKITNEQQLEIVERALTTTNAKASQAYLYGFYRTRNNPEKPKLTDEAIDKIIELWKNFYPTEVGPDRYISALLMKEHSGLVYHHFVDEDFISMDTQLAIEIIQGVMQNENNDPYAPVALNAFLNHKNPQVVVQSLRAIAENEGYSQQLDNTILNATALNVGVEDYVRLVGFNTSPNAKKYEDELLTIGQENPYLQNLRYSAFKRIWDESKVFDHLVTEINEATGLLYSNLLIELNKLWANADEEFKSDDKTEIAKEILMTALEKGERSNLLYALYSDENIITENDFEKFVTLLNDQSVVDDSDVFISVTSILKDRFEDNSEQVITELYSNADKKLKESLITQEWSFIEDSLPPIKFRTIDWDRLADLGPNPVWVLETKKGNIEVTLDVLTAPATISGMDSLLTNGHYDGVAFHRVVPNFVIQGGDVETGLGSGGPGYTVPTEGSSTQYFRGKAGVASSGTDTEGSQYFFMNVWAPHLNGGYTIFGEVTEGMSVVDRITQGDVVRNSYWK